MPPFTIYKGKNLYRQWTFGGPTNAGYGCSPSGWMEGINFEEWFRAIFIKTVAKEEKPVLLLFDGHNSHLTFSTVQAAIENQIILLCLPPHTSHRLQPWNVGFFGPFKTIWRDQLKSWARATKYQPVTKPIFPTLLKGAWEKISKKPITGGFLGIFHD